MPKMLKNEETAYWDRRCAKEVLYQGNMAWSTPGKSGWSNFLNDLAMSKPINWQPPKRRKIRELLPEQYTLLKRDMDLHEAGAEFISGSLDGVDLLNRTHVLGKSKITTRGPTFAGALDTTGVALMGTDFMSEQCQELIADCGGAPKCPSVCLDGASANKSGMRKSEQLSPTVAHTLCQFHGVSLWFNDVFNLPLVKDVVYKPALLVAKKFRGNKFARDQLQAMQQTASFKVMPQFIRGSKSFLLPPKTRACGKRIMLSRFADLHSSALATTVDPAWAAKFEGSAANGLAPADSEQSDASSDDDIDNEYSIVDVILESEAEDDEQPLSMKGQMAKVKKVLMSDTHKGAVDEVLDFTYQASKLKAKFDSNNFQACKVWRRWHDGGEWLKGFEAAHTKWGSSLSGLWGKRWEERHHPVFAMAHVLNPAEAMIDCMNDESIAQDVRSQMKAHFPDAVERSEMYSVLDQFHTQTGVFSLRDQDGDLRHEWSPQYIRNTPPWRWWTLMCGATHPKFAKFARRISQVLITSAALERIFSMWTVVCTKLRNRLSIENQRMALYCYVNWRLLEKSSEDLYDISSSDSD